MSLNRFRNQVSSRLKLLNRLIAMKEQALSKSPTGKINIHNFQNYTRYYIRSESDGTRTYISKNNVDLIKQLVQKDYDADVLKKAKKEKAMLERFIEKYPEVTMEEFYETMPQERRALVSPVWLPDDEFIKRWLEAPCEHKKIEEPEKCFRTNNGELVRSKSEKIIADRFKEKGVPYKYEAQLVLSDGTVIYPDFTLLKIATRSVEYWEHFGMMDDPGYSNKAAKRLRQYGRDKILIGNGLRITVETDRMPLDMALLDAMIDDFLGS